MQTTRNRVVSIWGRLDNYFRSSVGAVLEIVGLPKPLFSIVIFILTLAFVMPVFNQGDLNHTVVSSYAYLNGHFADFYDFNQPRMWGNDYLPILYLIFAIWMAPYFFLGLPVASESMGEFSLVPGEIIGIYPSEMIWAKLLLVVFFLGSVILVHRISKILHPTEANRQSVAVWVYVLSPFALFSFGVFSQYDIIGVVFTLAAIYRFLQRRMVGFAVLIGIALTFKFFAALLVLPLLLLSNKSWQQTFKLGLITLIPLFLQFAFYWSNESFRARIFVQLTSKAGGAATTWEAYFGVVAYLAILIGALFSSKWIGTFEQKTLFFVLASYGLMLNMVVWHPQWVILLSPFIALLVSYLRRPTLWMVWESIAFFVFIGFVVTFFQGNVDAVMISRGALGGVIPPTYVPMSQFVPAELFPWLLPFLKLYFLSPAISMLKPMYRGASNQQAISSFVWVSRSLTLWVAFIGPALIAVYFPEVVLQVFSFGPQG